MRRAFFFIVALLFATTSFASIPRARASSDASALLAPPFETRVMGSDVLAPFERQPESGLTRALRQAYEQTGTTNASGSVRFLSVDPSMDLKKTIRNPQMWNRYSYVVNNPIRYTDPDGREHVNEPGFTKPMTAENLAMDENTPAVVKGAFYAEGGLLALAGGVAAYEALETVALHVMVRIATWGGGGAATAEGLRRAAAGGGPTERVVTNLTQAPQEGRALSAAGGQGAQALANAARSGAGVRTFAANIPKALMSGLQQARLLEVRTTMMNGVTATEYRFAPGAAQYITKFFQDVTDKIAK